MDSSVHLPPRETALSQGRFCLRSRRGIRTLPAEVKLDSDRVAVKPNALLMTAHAIPSCTTAPSGALVSKDLAENMRGMSRCLHLCVFAISAVLVCGCASAPPPAAMRWVSSSNATQDRWLSDRRDCFTEAQQHAADGPADQYNKVDGPMCRAFNACLTARGYIRSDAAGTLTIPADASVQCATPST